MLYVVIFLAVLAAALAAALVFVHTHNRRPAAPTTPQGATTKEALRRRKVQAVPTPIGTVNIRVMSGKERDEWTKAVRVEQEKPEETTPIAIYTPLLLRTICDAAGNRIYSDSDDAEIHEMDSSVVVTLFTAALALNRIGEEVEAAEKKA